MRILFANSMKGLGGGERWLLDTASGLKGRGHEVWLAARPASPLLESAHTAGLAVLEVPFRHDLDPASILALRRHNLAERPEVVVAQIQRAHRLAALASAAGPRIPMVVRVGQRRAQKRGPLNRWTWGRTSMLLANCEAVQRDFVDAGIMPPSRARILWSGLADTGARGRPQSRARWNLVPGACAAVCLARLVKHKDHATLLRAWANVARLHPEAALLLAGDGPEEVGLRRLAGMLGISGSVRFLGHVEDTRALWAAADLGVLASRQEGAPYAILEAQRAGVACVGVRTAGVPELLSNGRAGLLVPAGEPDALAFAMRQLISNSALRAELGASGRKRFVQLHQLEAMLTRLEVFLGEAVHGR